MSLKILSFAVSRAVTTAWRARTAEISRPAARSTRDGRNAPPLLGMRSPSEIAAAEALYRIEFYAPLGENDSSWLRTMLAATPHLELDGFGDRLIAAGERRRELMGAWMRWAGECSGDLDVADDGCRLHAWNEACLRFIGLIDEDWYRVADWYRR